MFRTMVVTKITKRKRKQSDWPVDDHHVLDLTEDEGESKSVSMSVFEFFEEGEESSPKKVSSSCDRGFLSDYEDEKKILSFSSAKNPPLVKYTRKSRVHEQIPTDSEFESALKRVPSQIVLPVHTIQPSIQFEYLYLKFSAEAVEVRGGDNEKDLVHEWPLENIVGIVIRYCNEWEEDTRAFITVRVSAPLSSLFESSKKSEEYVLELLKLKDSMADISKLSPIYGSIIEELKKEDVERAARAIEMPKPLSSTSLCTSSSEEADVEKTDQALELSNSKAYTSLSTPSSEELGKAITTFKTLVYPQGDPDAVTITQKDLKILKPFEFLNDTIIDFYIKYLQQTIVSPEKLKTLHFFNSFFFSKLAEAETHGLTAFERVKKWTRKVNVFEKAFVFIPVNQSLHWSLVIICHPGHMWDAPTINGSCDGDACILHLDSMEGCHRGVDGHIKNYLLQEWLERNKDPVDRARAERFFSEMPFRYSKVPQQDNSCDCGLFLLHYVELFLKTAPSTYRMKRQSSPPTQFLRRNWFIPSEASAKRLVIQKLLLELSQGRTSELCRDYLETEDNTPNEEFSAEEEIVMSSSMAVRDDKKIELLSITALDWVHSDSQHPLKEPLTENSSPPRSKKVEWKNDIGGTISSDRQEKHGKVEHSGVSIEDNFFDDGCICLHHFVSDQSRVGYESGTDQSTAHILVVDDDLNSRPATFTLHDDEIWTYEKCSVPILQLQVKPLQISSVVDEQVPLYCQPSAVVDLGTQDGPEINDDSSCSLPINAARESEKPLEFDSIPVDDDEMFLSSYSDTLVRLATSNVQSVKHALSKSPEALDSLQDDAFKEDGRIDEGGRRPVRFRNKTSPVGRCSEFSMQGALKCGQRKHTEDRVLTQKDSNQPYGYNSCREEVQEIQALSSDDSSDSSKRRDVKKKTLEPNGKRTLTETLKRVTRSGSSRELILSAEKKSKKNALEDLLCLRNRRRSRGGD